MHEIKSMLKSVMLVVYQLAKTSMQRATVIDNQT